ncbi:carboxypeptidase-like regulatory domain-containing protein [Frateuria sp. STR12]|uniref:carboxypeptidase-like regulatory domain-containing protein n=1 Tax=Frateuria hangzhouensis TaxID=2995589 RepID=UPI002260A0D5|nr:carboxypeptidase-like regulatory domain-containing protein [Frateuria sp. STR12]MCX7512168.1 carboxypeptidase-like regulatory domain-containing protein [Frateuria sp. STR12]
MNASFSIHPRVSRRSLARNMALVAVVGICAAAGSGASQAAVTKGSVFGDAPAGAMVQVSSAEFGINRTIPVNAKGRYQVGWLPIGIYTVTVLDHGQPRARHPSVQVYVDRGSRVDMGCGYGRCTELAAN